MEDYIKGCSLKKDIMGTKKKKEYHNEKTEIKHQ